MNLRRHLADTLTRLAGAIRPPHAMGAHPSAATGAGWTELPRRVERNGTFRFNGVAYLAPRATWGDLVVVKLASQCPACAEVPILRRPAVPSVDSASAPEALS